MFSGRVGIGFVKFRGFSCVFLRGINNSTPNLSVFIGYKSDFVNDFK